MHADIASVPDGDRVDLLIRLLAEARLSVDFEQVYRVIFGSQLSGLRELNVRKRVTLGEAREFFDGFAAQHPDAYSETNSFEFWLRLLELRGLIERTEDAIQITARGSDFLLYITAKGYSENKPL